MLITIIGSGNVATHMAAAFKNAGHRILQVFSPTINNAALLAYHVGAQAVDDLSAIDAAADIFIISIKDDAIADVAQALAVHNKLIVHTSGATDMQVLLNVTNKAGVLYPLQTFSKTREVDFLTVPLCIEASTDENQKLLWELATTVSNNVYKVNSAQRKVLHLSAVFACNFPNYLYGVAQQLLARHDMEFDMLKPLIMETAQKVQQQLPATVQTGPAVRNDEGTMSAHLQMLAHMPDLQQMYALLSQGIIKNNNGTQGDK